MAYRRYLDDPYLHQQLLAETALANLRQLASDDALPQRIRSRCAKLYGRLRPVARALRHPKAIERERHQDDLL
jgi:hypothetical protein